MAIHNTHTSRRNYSLGGPCAGTRSFIPTPQCSGFRPNDANRSPVRSPNTERSAIARHRRDNRRSGFGTPTRSRYLSTAPANVNIIRPGNACDSHHPRRGQSHSGADDPNHIPIANPRFTHGPLDPHTGLPHACGVDPNQVPIANPGSSNGSIFGSISSPRPIRMVNTAVPNTAGSHLNTHYNFNTGSADNSPTDNSNTSGQPLNSQEKFKPNTMPKPKRPQNTYKGRNIIKRLVQNKRLRAVLAGTKVPPVRRRVRDMDLRMGERGKLSK